MSKTCVYADDKGLVVPGVYAVQCCLQIHSMYRLFQCPVKVKERAFIAGQMSTYERAETISSRTVGADANNNDILQTGRLVQMEQQTMDDG
ncbi:hypothetical protein ASL14_11950 [Paenibacillus sp. IHB B 3084]|nr:hypothetical protein ASL14_11950 [Paenibacillus sp. IHB B 3084]